MFVLAVQSLQFLGSITDSRDGHLTFPEIGIKKSLETLIDIDSELRTKGKVLLKQVASFVGQIISIVIVIKEIELIMTKSLSVDIIKAETWRPCTILSEKVKNS